MILFSTAQVRFAIRDADLVILDVEAGSYACLPGVGGATHPACDGAALDVFDLELADLLQSVGMRTVAPPAPLAAGASLPTPRHDLFDSEPVRATQQDFATLALAYGDMARDFYGRSFGHLIAVAQRGQGAPALASDAVPSRTTWRQAAAFRRWLPWIPFQGDCLYRSFMLRSALRRRGETARWVFGVQTWPFEAHCWLQVGDVVLDDAAERVAAFTPILVV